MVFKLDSNLLRYSMSCCGFSKYLTNRWRERENKYRDGERLNPQNLSTNSIESWCLLHTCSSPLYHWSICHDEHTTVIQLSNNLLPWQHSISQSAIWSLPYSLGDDSRSYGHINSSKRCHKVPLDGQSWSTFLFGGVTTPYSVQITGTATDGRNIDGLKLGEELLL